MKAVIFNTIECARYLEGELRLGDVREAEALVNTSATLPARPYKTERPRCFSEVVFLAVRVELRVRL